MFNLSDKLNPLKFQFTCKLFKLVMATAIACNRQCRFSKTLPNAAERSQDTINTVMRFEISIRKKGWGQLLTRAKLKNVAFDRVVNCACLQSKPRENSD